IGTSSLTKSHPPHHHRHHLANALSDTSSVTPHYHWYLWTALASVIYGSVSIWALHFLAMLAQSFEPSGVMLLHPTLTILSVPARTAVKVHVYLSPSYWSPLAKFFTTSGSSRSTGNHNSLNPIGLAVTANQESDRSSSEEPLLSLELGPLSPAVSILSDQTNPQHPADSHGIPTTPGSPNPETPRKKIGLFVVAWSGLRLPTLIRATVGPPPWH
ncbi:hypothetical protein H4Q26_017423, partial [Puccinia striiformis f. sp. tritici PST-130]